MPSTRQARGTFEVKLTPQPSGVDPELAPHRRMAIEKSFRGDLEATSKGEMLAAGTATQGSAGYVAIEKVSGTLGGREGSFVLQHSGVMTRGDGKLTIIVVPDSGTGGLEGVAGTMAITVEGGKHCYTFDYTLPD